MKGPNHTFRVFLLVSIYCFGLLSAANTIPFSKEFTVEQNNGHTEYLEASSKVLSPHAQQTEVAIADLAEYASPNYKLPFAGFVIYLTANEVLYNSNYKQYERYANTLLIRHRKSNLIFPFHSFW